MRAARTSASTVTREERRAERSSVVRAASSAGTGAAGKGTQGPVVAARRPLGNRLSRRLVSPFSRRSWIPPRTLSSFERSPCFAFTKRVRTSFRRPSSWGTRPSPSWVCWYSNRPGADDPDPAGRVLVVTRDIDQPIRVDHRVKGLLEPLARVEQALEDRKGAPASGLEQLHVIVAEIDPGRRHGLVRAREGVEDGKKRLSRRGSRRAWPASSPRPRCPRARREWRRTRDSGCRA